MQVQQRKDSKDQAGASEVVDQEVVNLIRVISELLPICLDVIFTLFCNMYIVILRKMCYMYVVTQT